MTTLFGARLAGMPFTHLARTAHPARGRVDSPWHYWWQAHYLDAVVDAGTALPPQRRPRTGLAPGPAPATGCCGRSGCATAARWVNDYYDDMAWLALASGPARAAACGARPGPTSAAPAHRGARPHATAAVGPDRRARRWPLLERRARLQERARERPGCAAPRPARTHRRGARHRRLALCPALVRRERPVPRRRAAGVRATSAAPASALRAPRSSCPTSGPTTRARCWAPSSPSVTRRASERAADLVAAVQRSADDRGGRHTAAAHARRR